MRITNNLSVPVFLGDAKVQEYNPLGIRIEVGGFVDVDDDIRRSVAVKNAITRGDISVSLFDSAQESSVVQADIDAAVGAISPGASDFVSLTDTPASFPGPNVGDSVVINSAANALEYRPRMQLSGPLGAIVKGAGSEGLMVETGLSIGSGTATISGNGSIAMMGVANLDGPIVPGPGGAAYITATLAGPSVTFTVHDDAGAPSPAPASFHYLILSFA